MTDRAAHKTAGSRHGFPRAGFGAIVGLNAIMYSALVAAIFIHELDFIGHYLALGILVAMMGLASYASYRILRGQERARSAMGRAIADTHFANTRLDAFFAGAPSGMAILDRDLNCIKWNHTLVSMSGRDPLDFDGGCRIIDALPEENAESLAAAIRHGFETGEPLAGVETTGPAGKDGVPRIWTISHFPIRSDNGGVEALGLVVTDITDRRQTSRQFEIAARELAMAQQIAGIGNWRWKVATNEENWSDQFYRNLGLEPGSCPASVDRFYESVHPDDRVPVRREIENVVETGEHYSRDFRIVWPDGSVRIVHEEAEPLIGDNGEVVELFGTMQDVTEIRSAEDHLRRLSGSFANAQRISKTGNWDWDANTGKEWWSDEVYRIMGLAPQSVEASFEAFMERIHIDERDRVKAVITQAQKNGKPYDTIFRVIRPDGEERFVRETGEPDLDDDGVLKGLNGTVQDITEQYRNDQERIVATQRLEMAMRLAQLGSWEWDPESNLLKISEGAQIACGLNSDCTEIDNDLITAMIPKDDQARVTNLMEKAVATGEGYSHEHTIQWPNGEEHRLLEHAEPIRDPATGKVKLIGTIQDITEQRDAERYLRDTMESLTHAQKLARMGSWVWDMESGAVTGSEEMYRIYDLNSDGPPLTMDVFIERVHPDDREQYETVLRGVQQTGETYEISYRVIHPDGRELIVDEQGEIVEGRPDALPRFRGTVQDVTERRRMEDALRDSEELFRAMFNQAAVSIVQSLPDGRFSRANTAFAKFLGYPPEELESLRFQEVTHPDDLAVELANDQRLLDREVDAYSMEKRYIRADGRIVWGELTVSLVRNPDGTPKYHIGVVQDIDARKNAEEQAVRSNRYLNLFFKHALTSLALMDRDFNFIRVNEAYARADEKQPEDFPGKNHFDLYPSDARSLFEKVRDTREPFLATAMPFEYADSPERGTTYWDWSLAPVTGEDGVTELMVLSLNNVSERVRAEHALEGSEALFRGAFDQAAVGIILTESDGRFRRANAKMSEIFGYSEEEMLGMTYVDVTHPDDLEMTDEAHVELRKGEVQSLPLEKRYVRKDGSVVWCRTTISYMRDGEGVHHGTIGLVEDIDDRKKAEEALAESLSSLAEAQRIGRIGGWELDLQSGNLSWSDENYKLIGVDPETFVPTYDTLMELVHPDDRAAMMAHNEQLLAGDAEKDLEYRIICPDGETRIFLSRGEAVHDKYGKTCCLRGTVQDITRRKLVEQALEESEALFRGAFDQAAVGILLTEVDGRFKRANRKMCEILGYTEDELCRMTYPDITHPDDMKASDEAHIELQKGVTTNVPLEKRYIRKDGGTVWCRTTVSYMWDAEGAHLGNIGLIEDISDRKKAEAELQQTTARLTEAQRLAHIGNWEWRPNTEESFWSDEMFRIFAVERGSAAQTHDEFYKMVHEDDRDHLFALMEQVIETGETYETEFRAQRGDGEWRNFYERGERYRNEETGIFSIRGFVQDITERKRAEEKLRNTLENLQQAQRVAKLGSWSWDILKDEEWWSDEVYAMYGLEPGFAIFNGYGFLDYVHPDDREQARIATDRSREEGVPFDMEYRLMTGDGREVMVAEYGETEFDEAGKPIRMRGTIQDITDRKQAEQALAESEARLEAFFSKAPVSMGIIDSDGRYVRVNDTLARMNGIAAADHIGRRPRDILHPAKAEHVENLMRRTLEDGESLDRVESIVPLPDGTAQYRVYSQFPLSGDPKKPDNIAFVIVDMTDLKMAEQELVKLAANLEEAQRIAHLGSWEWNPDEGTEWWSDEHCRIFGLEPGNFMPDGFGFLRYVHPDDRDRVEKEQRLAADMGEAFSMEYRIVRPDGAVRVVSERGEMERGEDGKSHWWGTMLDITEYKLIEQQLAQLNAELEQRVEDRTAELRDAQAELIKNERLATLGQLTATVSHELRNPLGAMRTSMYVVEKKTEGQDERLSNAIQRVNRSIVRCDRIIDELLDYTRIRDLEIAHLRIDNWLGTVLDDQAPVEGITVRRKFAAEDVKAPADSDRLRRAVINLYENACQALSAAAADGKSAGKKELTVETRIRKDRVEICFADNGEGVPDDLKEKIFEPLFSTKNFGVGLGLPTVKQIMRQHGGDIEVRDRRGGGAIFALWLPLSPEMEGTDA